jgi:undecaprenyl-phosphate galactose phosphotransferase
LASLTSSRFANRMELVSADLRTTAEPHHRPVVCSVALFAADGVSVAFALSSIVFVRHQFGWPVIGGNVLVSPEAGMLFAALIVYLASQGRYGDRIMFWNEMRLLVCASGCAIGVEVALGLLAGDVLARGPMFAGLLVFPAVATAFNRLAKHILHRTGVWELPIVVVGDGPNAAEAEASLTSDRLSGYRFVGRVDSATVLSVPGLKRLWPVLHRHGASHLLVALDGEGDQQRRVIECALREQVPFVLVPQPNALPAFAFAATSRFGHDAILMSYRHGLSRPGSRIIKAAIDIAVAALMLVLASPLFLILAVVSRLDGGPVLFAHRRVGAGGRPFWCLKFRTMVVDADHVLDEALARNPALAAEWAATRKLVDDPRVTRIGRFLRKTSLDELPQLINVLRLEMSMVGPRPIVESEVPLYGDAIAQYHATRPGITGLWQVSGRSDTSYAKRVQLDVWYVNNWTVWNDIAVLLKTFPVVLNRRGAR